MTRATLLPLLALLACSSDPERLPPPNPATSASSVGSGGDGGAGATGGIGGAASSSQASSSSAGGAPPCDPYAEGSSCCTASQFCPPGSAGECSIMESLCSAGLDGCGDEPCCVGKPQPIVGKPCANGVGTCDGTECVLPPVGGAGVEGGGP